MKKQVLLSIVVMLLSAFLSGCGCGGGDEAPYLVSIEVSPANPSIALGMSQQFRATGVFSNSTTLDLTEAVVWATSHQAIATISNAEKSMGLAQGTGAGTTTVTATSGAISGSTTLTVTGASVSLVSIAVTPANPSVPVGTPQQFTATGTYSDGSHQNLTETADWSSSATGIASISNAAGTRGRADSHSVGTTTITATSGAVSGSTTMTVTGGGGSVSLVSIEVTPANPAVAKGTPQQFTATGIYSDQSKKDITTSVTWSSSSLSVAAISNAAGSQGLASTLSGGNSTITASLSGISGSTILTVNDVFLVSIKVTPENRIVKFGTTLQYYATGTYSDGSQQDITTAVTWSSSDTTIATISNAPGTKGQATTDHKRGRTTITATQGAVSGSTLLIDP